MPQKRYFLEFFEFRGAEGVRRSMCLYCTPLQITTDHRSTTLAFAALRLCLHNRNAQQKVKFPVSTLKIVKIRKRIEIGKKQNRTFESTRQCRHVQCPNNLWILMCGTESARSALAIGRCQPSTKTYQVSQQVWQRTV